MLNKYFCMVLLTGLTLASGLRAQYRWHIVHPDRIDTFYYGFTDLSCSGESCSAAAIVWGYTPGEPSFFQMPDSNFILHSTDGGRTWNRIDSALPQWHYSSHGKNHIIFEAIDQIDSLDAIAVGSHNTIVRTIDGWKTLRIDTSIHPIVQGVDSAFFHFSYPDFSNAAEGVVLDEALGYSLSTVDSGKHWLEQKGGGTLHSYGNGMFRSFIGSIPRFPTPDTMRTTYDNWKTIDTSFITQNGALSDTAAHWYSLKFGTGDTLAYIGYVWDTDDYRRSVRMARSTDLGAHWTESSLPRNIKISPDAVLSPIDANTVVMTGKDSLNQIAQLILSTDRGDTWEADTVPLDNGAPYYWIKSVAVSGSGRVLASIVTNGNFQGSEVLAYLEKTPSHVTPTSPSHEDLVLYPDPCSNVLNINAGSTTVFISDPLGRSYALPRRRNALDTSTLPSGVYFVSDGIKFARFLKE